MNRRWVSDASPLIALAKIGRADLLMTLPDELAIPEAVAQEIRRGPVEDPARRWLKASGTSYIVSSEAIARAVAAWDLGRGESAVLSWANERPAWEAIIDDRAARNCGETLGISVRGTLGVLLLGNQEGHIERMRPLVDELTGVGLRVSPDVIDTILRLSGE